MVQLLIVVGILVVFEAISLRYGVDSRDGDDWFFRRHDHPTGPDGAPRIPV